MSVQKCLMWLARKVDSGGDRVILDEDERDKEKESDSIEMSRSERLVPAGNGTVTESDSGVWVHE